MRNPSTANAVTTQLRLLVDQSRRPREGSEPRQWGPHPIVPRDPRSYGLTAHCSYKRGAGWTLPVARPGVSARMLGVVRTATHSARSTSQLSEADGGAFALGHRAMPVTTIIILVVLFIVGWLTVGGAQMSTHQIKTPAVTQNPPAAAAASFHGVLRYHDSSRWGRAITLALAQWNAAHIGVTFKPSTDAEGADVLIVSDQSTLNSVRTAMASRIGIQPGEPVTITLGNPPAFPPSGADVRLVVHELGHVLGLSHSRTPCAVMNSDAQWLPDCHRLGWFVSNGKAMCGPTLGDVRRAQGIWGGNPPRLTRTAPPPRRLMRAASGLSTCGRNIPQITARALLSVDHERASPTVPQTRRHAWTRPG